MTKKLTWNLKLKNSFGWSLERKSLKVWEFLLLIIGVFIKEIIEIILATIYSSTKSTISSLFSSVGGSLGILSKNLFWIILCKGVFGFIISAYLIYKYRKSNNLLIIVVFCCYSTLILLLEKIVEEINKSNQYTNLFSYISFVTSTFIFYCFFRLDVSNIDALKLAFYSDMYYNSLDRRLYSYKPRNWNKFFKFLLISLTITIIATAMTKAIIWFINQSRGNVNSNIFWNKSLNIISKNQQKIDKEFEKNPVWTSISAIVMAPIIEEYIFRGIVMQLNKSWLSIVLGSFVFGLIHMSEGEDLIQIIPYLIPGITLGIGYKFINNIWATIIAHGAYNCLIIVVKILKIQWF